MKVLHLVPGLTSSANGIAVAAKLIAAAQEADLVDCRRVKDCDLSRYDEVWVHSMWSPRVWKSCRRVLAAQHAVEQSNNRAIEQSPRLVRMLHGCLDPLRVGYHGWKKTLVAPIERWLFAHCDRVVVTGPWEEEWCRVWGVKGPFETVDLKRFFKLGEKGGMIDGDEPLRGEHGLENPCPEDALNRSTNQEVRASELHLLYLGRPHPLKGLQFLEAALRQLTTSSRSESAPEVDVSTGCLPNRTIEQSNNRTISFRSVGNAFGEEKEKVWDWCDVLVLPTLSENFGLVVAEALERGKRVITTDGAPAWENGKLKIENGKWKAGNGGNGKLKIENGKWKAGNGEDGKCGMENEESGKGKHVDGIEIGYGGRLIYLKGYREGTRERRVELLKRALAGCLQKGWGLPDE